MASLQCEQISNISRSLTIAYQDIYEYERAWTVRDDPLNAFGGTADTRRFCIVKSFLGLQYNITQDLCDETLHLGMVGQRPWAGCYADTGHVPHVEPGNPEQGLHEDTWCWLWESSYTCNNVIDQLLNEKKDKARLPFGAVSTDPKNHLIGSLGSIGCNPFVDPITQRSKTNCLFENPNGNYTHSSRPHVLNAEETEFPYSIRSNVTYSAVCNIKSASFNGIALVDSQSDYRYKPICCSLNNVQEMLITQEGSAQSLYQIDPITGGPLTPFVCDESWCLDDPYGACRDMFLQNCTGTSSCNRHNYLSTYNPVLNPQVDPMALELLQIVSVSGYSPQAQPFGGLPCNAYYKKTRELSAALPTLLGNDFSITLLRISEIQEQVSSYCSDPSTRGNGECGCLRGYQSLGAGFTPSTNPSGFQGMSPYQTSVTYFSVPSSIKKFSHRVDLFCDPNGANSSAFFGLLSYSSRDGETSCTTNTPAQSCITFSNACSSLTDAGQYPLLGGLLGKKYPTLNPNASILSSTNYGDAISLREKNPSVFFGNQGGFGSPARNPFSIPYRCWLPACVDFQVQDVIFNDLLQNSPCPDVCYAYGGSQAIDMTNVDANVISMGNFVNQCNYDGNSATVNVDPFVLPALLMNGFQFDVPQGYKGSLTFNIFNSELDVASVASSKTVAIFTDIPQYVSVTQDVTQLYKYSYTQLNPGSEAHDSISVTLSVNADSQNPAYYQMNMFLQDSNLGSMRIPITLNIFSTLSNPNSESNWPRACAFYTDSLSNNWTDAKCHIVNCSFGSNSFLTNAVKPPFCEFSGGLQGINFSAFFRVNTQLLQTGEFTEDGIPLVTRISRARLPVTNYPDQTRNSLFNSTDLTLLGFSRLLDTHVQLFGPTPSEPFYRTNPSFNIVA